MPTIQSLSCSGNSLTVVAATGGSQTLSDALISVGLVTAQDVENSVNASLALAFPEAQVCVHVFTRTPLSMSLAAFPLGVTPPASWWVKDR